MQLGPTGAATVAAVLSAPYTDNDVGAAGSTGRGESNIMVCGGEFGAASLYPGQYAAHHGRTAARRNSAHLFEKPT